MTRLNTVLRYALIAVLWPILVGVFAAYFGNVLFGGVLSTVLVAGWLGRDYIRSWIAAWRSDDSPDDAQTTLSDHADE